MVIWQGENQHVGEEIGYSKGPQVMWLSGKNPPVNLKDPSLIPGLGSSLEKEMATHSNILAWRIPMDRGAW